MSGIFLAIKKSGFTNEENDQARACSELINHRGNEKIKIFKEKNWISFFYELRISNEKNFYYDDAFLILIDGKIYNLKEISKKYNIEYQNFNELETFSSLFSKLNTGIIGELNGMFSILIIDKKKNKIYAIKDKLGLKPFFYFYDNDELIISSEAKSILKKKDSCKIDYQSSLASIFLCGRPPYGKTHFKNVFDIEQSNYLEFSINDFKPKIHNYFNLSLWIDKKNMKIIKN